MARLTVGACALVLLVACQGASAPTAPSSLDLTGWSAHAGVLRAEAEAGQGPVYRTLASTSIAGDGTFTLTLPAQLPVDVMRDVDDLPSYLCPGATATALAASRETVSLSDVHELWLDANHRLEALVLATRPGLHAGLGSDFEGGDAFARWTYVEQALRVSGECAYGSGTSGVTQLVDLDLRAGWNTIVTEVVSASAGWPTALRLVDTLPSAATWHVARVVAPDTDVTRVPSSRSHANGSWWGYHQNKLLRRGEDVFLSVVSPGEPADADDAFRLLHRAGRAGPWTPLLDAGDWRSGHLLLDADGGSHMLTFRPDSPDSTVHGSLRTQHFDAGGAIDAERVIHPDVNVRFGATVLPDGRLLAVWGGKASMEHPGFEALYLTMGDGTAITWDDAIELTVDRSYHYPYVVADHERAVIASVENRHDAGGNYFQQVHLWQVSLNGLGVHDETLLLDYSGVPMATSRRVLVEVSDLLMDATGRTHVLVKEFLHPHAPRTISGWRYLVKDDATTPWRDPTVSDADDRSPGGIDTRGFDCTWLRLTELPGLAEPAVVCSTFTGLAVFGLLSGDALELRVPPSSRGHQPHLAAPRSGTDRDEASLDVLLLPAWAGAYPHAGSFLLRIDKVAIATAVQELGAP